MIVSLIVDPAALDAVYLEQINGYRFNVHAF